MFGDGILHAMPVRHVAVLNEFTATFPRSNRSSPTWTVNPWTRSSAAAMCSGGRTSPNVWHSYESRGARFLTGNSERDVLAAIDDQYAWCAARLSPRSGDSSPPGQPRSTSR